MTEWTHHGLLIDLADWFFADKIVFAEVGIGSRWIQGGKIPIPDVLTLNRSYTRPVPTIYEVKITKADFRSDIRSDKWIRYLKYSQKFYFAVPRGLLKKVEVPEEAGLIVRGDNGWSVIKAPHVRKESGMDTWDVQALLMAGAYTGQKVRRLKDQVIFEENCELGDRARKIGYEISRAINRLQGSEASGSQDGQRVLKTIAKILDISVPELLGVSTWDIEFRLFDRERVENACMLVKRSVKLLEAQVTYEADSKSTELEIKKGEKSLANKLKMLREKTRT